MNRILLAYSGGLVNSVAIHWLRYRRNMRVFTFTANLGQNEDAEELGEKALELGAESVHMFDLRNVFLTDYAFEALKANAVYEDAYYLSAALSRPLIAAEMINIAKEEGIKYVGHGCSGKGNDQFRFEATFSGIAPKLEIIAPRREWSFQHLNEVISYAKRHRIQLPEDELRFDYSKDKNIWGARITGIPLEDPSAPTPENAFQWTVSPENAPDKAEEFSIEFISGVPVAINFEKKHPVTLVEELNALGAKHGIGRESHVENRFIGAKIREVYEAPAAEILHTAKKALEKITLDRATQHFLPIISAKFAQIVYNGFWHSKLREAISAFVNTVQEKVTGKINVKLFKGKVTIQGCKSPYSLYSKETATIEKAGAVDTDAVSGWLRLITQAQRSAAKINISSKSSRIRKIRLDDVDSQETEKD
ncbi:MAG: argininosuccinate synthase [Planctomycetes bacterium]|nr:argininosuccinate synthase [Planctomycetota bacterium]